MTSLHNYHIQITGPSGSGKSHFAKKLQELGYPAVDADKIEKLGRFINSHGEEVEYNHDGDLHWLQENLWMWDIAFLHKYLKDKQRIILFGGATNESEAVNEFDYIFYLKLPKDKILHNLLREERTNPYGKTEAQQSYAASKIDSFYTI
jgi:shikimate kinase